ncbi:MAG TPA: hypothetical protein VNS55_10050 [Nocardioides sp.]|nr:hypothetical protein [Nocardioides sp.]
MVATVLAFLLAPYLSDNEPAAAGGAEMTSATARGGHGTAVLSRDDSRPVATVERRGPTPVTEHDQPKKKQPEPRPTTIGVVSLNQFYQLSTSQIAADARRITALPTVDVVGWQEATNSHPVFAALARRGWQTSQLPRTSHELAVSWRRSEFAFVSARFRLVAHGVDDVEGRYPFGNRYVQRVTLRQRDTGRLLTVINTHLPQKIEDLDHPGHWLGTSNAARARFQLARIARAWREARGRWIVGTGDYNFDARADAEVHPHGGPRAALGPLAVSSYGALGFGGLTPSHPPTGRYVDYVQADRSDLHAGEMRFVGQRIIAGLNSDHNALLARIRLD